MVITPLISFNMTVSGSAMTTIETLPVELQDNIIGHLDHPSYLLSLSLTSRHFHALIVPNHISYRRMALFDYSHAKACRLWEHLGATPALAQNVRLLRFGVNNSLKVPAMRYNPSSKSRSQYALPSTRERLLEARSKFAYALNVMKDLRSFTWRTNEGDWFENNDWLWDALSCASRLKVLDVDVWVGSTPVEEHSSRLISVTRVSLVAGSNSPQDSWVRV